ncbi:Ger(x)C family spore germination protein [Bacillus tuaregi]|uniref:Ger(x)C family spore germination protein n=1 Tax=Bacillus tuaregi TaxID=1816695 RepID=UPI0008F863FB|nr:Ger(x)C family spore germination protein [Bacillus tuaregi]
MKKKRISIVLILNILLLAGCWDQRDLATISLAIGMAVDIGDNGKYKLTIEAINAAELNEQTASGNSPTVTFSLEGNTLAELSHKMNIGFSKILVFSHMKTVVISKTLAEKGMLEFLDFLDRNREIRDDFNFILVDGKAANVLKVLYTLQKSSSLKLTRQLKSAKLWGSDPDIRLTDFVNAFTSSGRQPVMAAVRINGDPKKGSSVENMQKSDPDAMVEIDSLAMFRGEKYVGTLPVEETRDYLWTQDKVKTTIFSVPCEEDMYMAVRATHSRTMVKGFVQNGRPHIQLHIRIEGLVNSNQCKDPLNEVSTYLKFEKLSEEYLKERIEKMIHLVQKEYGVDIFGFGEVIERENPKAYKKLQENWDEVFQESKIDVTVDVKLRRSGLLSKGLLEREGTK